MTKDRSVQFVETRLADAMLIELDRMSDSRGYFARTFCAEEFAAKSLARTFVQANHSYNVRAGTVRGMHFQKAPHAEVKLVRCLHGAIHDVIIDLRPASPTFKHWQGFDLTAENGTGLYVPEGFAHGFQTLMDDTDVTYHVTYPYTPEAEGGLRYDDPLFGIEWPRPVSVISDKDAAWPLTSQEALARGVAR